jgi:hypothetical protein
MEDDNVTNDNSGHRQPPQTTAARTPSLKQNMGCCRNIRQDEFCQQ